MKENVQQTNVYDTLLKSYQFFKYHLRMVKDVDLKRKDGAGGIIVPQK